MSTSPTDDLSGDPDFFNPDNVPIGNGYQWKNGFEVGRWRDIAEAISERTVFSCIEFKPKSNFE